MSFAARSAAAQVIDTENHLNATAGGDGLYYRISPINQVRLSSIDHDAGSRVPPAHEFGTCDHPGTAPDHAWAQTQILRGIELPPEFSDRANGNRLFRP